MTTLALSRRRTSVWSVFGILAALATALAVYSYLAYVKSRLPLAGALTPMVVAKHDLDPGTTLVASMLEVADHPGRYLPEGAIADPDLVVGKVLTVPVFRGEPLIAKKLSNKGGLSSVVPPGMRAYWLAVAPSTSPASRPRPGDRVDVLATFPREVMGEPMTITLTTFIEVAAVGASGSTGSGKVANRLGVDSPTEGLGLTLFVTPEDAEKLAMAEALGKITVVLSPIRQEQTRPEPLKPADLHK